MANKNPFEFIKHLQGCHKGDKIKGLRELKQYLEKFGYLNYNQSNLPVHAADDNFDELLESVVKTYQLNYHLKVTGNLDFQTVTTMTMPRCGMADIVDGTSQMRSGKRGTRHSLSNFHSLPLHFLQWESQMAILKVPPHLCLLSRDPDQRGGPHLAGFQDMNLGNTLNILSGPNFGSADIKIGFARRDHGDYAPFDGPDGIVAHAFQPSIGMFHYDADEPWSMGPVHDSHNMETVALHEIGHLLGLGHSSVEGAIMYLPISPGISKGLHWDDVQGIKTLYGV